MNDLSLLFSFFKINLQMIKAIYEATDALTIGSVATPASDNTNTKSENIDILIKCLCLFNAT
jgi:hypothetical protein